MLSDLIFRLRALFRRESVEHELDEELRFHLQRETEKLVASGLLPAEAERTARLRLGGMEQVKEEVRTSWAVGLADTIARDLRYAARAFRKSPGFSFTAVLSLAIAIGATTTVFSVVNAVVLNPMPYPEVDRIAAVLESKASQNLDWLYVTNNNFLEWRQRATSFEQLVAATNCGFRKEGTEARLFEGMCASAEFLPMLGVQPVLGRLWTVENTTLGREHVAVLSYDAWQNDFAGDPNILGKTVLRINDQQPYSIIGVLPRDFQFASENTKIWSPLAIDRTSTANKYHILLVFGRLKRGVSYQQARAEMNRIAEDLEKEQPQTNNGWRITVRPMADFYSNQGNTRATLLVLMAAVAGLLLIACANVANLLLARATVRQREIAVRAAIGATRGRIIRQLLTESVLLGAAAGAFGFVLAWAALPPILAMAPRIDLFRPNALRIDLRVFLFSLAVSLVSSIVFGIAPALRTAKEGVAGTLTEAGRGGHVSVRTMLTRNALVIAEISLAVVLLTGTGLFIRTLRNLQHDHLGYDSSHVVTLSVCCLDQVHFPTQTEINAFYQQAFQRVRELPGVKAASATSGLPTRSFDGGGSQFAIQGFPPPGPGHEYLADFRFVEPEYFRTMGIGLLQGRLFTAADDGQRDPYVVINERLAKRYWPDSSAIGQQILFNASPKPYTIIGVVANSRDRGLGKDTRNTLYFDDLQTNTGASRGFQLLVRTQVDDPALVKSVRETLLSVDRDLYIGEPRTLDEVLSRSLSPQRFSAVLMTGFAIIAFALAVIGIYGVTAYAVAQRRQEIGVRMALGARPSDIMVMVLRQGTRLALWGVGFGILGALLTTRLANGLLFGVSARDPLTILSVCATFAATAILACCVPARRAMRVEPVSALRAE